MSIEDLWNQNRAKDFLTRLESVKTINDKDVDNI